MLFSDVGSLTELKGPGAVVLPVDDLAGLGADDRPAAAVACPRLRRPDRIARAWARQYSWDAYTDRTLAVYDMVRLNGSVVATGPGVKERTT